MSVALELSRGFASHEQELPSALADVRERAQFIHAIDGLLLVDGQGAAHFDELAARLREMAARSELLMAGVPDPFDRAAIALRL